jgi:hypothetical protein
VDDPEDATKPIKIVRVELLERGAPSLGVFASNGEATLRLHYDAREPIASPHFAIDIHNGDGVYCYGSGTFQDGDLGTLDGPGAIDLRLPRLALLPGSYVISAGIHRGDGQGLYDLQLKTYPFSVVSDNRDKGIVALEHAWELQPAARRSSTPTSVT